MDIILEILEQWLDILLEQLIKIGYIIIKINRKDYQAHRLAWLYEYGNFPKQTIDHINRIKTDNRICNLRDVSQSKKF